MTYKMRDPGRREGFKGFDEDKHPRDKGKFTFSGGGGDSHDPIDSRHVAMQLREALVDHVAEGGSTRKDPNAAMHMQRLADHLGRGVESLHREIGSEGRMQRQDENEVEGPDGLTPSERAHFGKR